jgi:glycerol-3-phosphate dehydrogenase (NAD(P)+)
VKPKDIAILGAGGWGSALSVLWAKKGGDVLLWGHNSSRIDRLRATRENADYLPGIRLPESVDLTSDLKDCAAADLIVFVPPSTALRSIAMNLRELITNRSAILLSCTKGIEHGTGMRMSEILRELFPTHRIAVLSGPNLAVEVSREVPTATVLACTEKEVASELQSYLASPRFRIYTGDDLIGIELGGALKNVFAIAAGASDGLGLGDNSKAALITRCLAEMIRLGTAMGGALNTFYGLSGAGDLILTCFSRHSRNRGVGEQLGSGGSLQQITSSMQMVAEGIPTAKSAYECARKLGIETPIIDQVYSMLYSDKTATQVMHDLLSRDQKPERI